MLNGKVIIRGLKLYLTTNRYPMTHAVRKFFITLLFTISLLGSQLSYAQVYDGPVGDNKIPNSYEGFDQGNRPMGNAPVPPGPNPCEFQDPLNPLCPIDDYVYVLLLLGVGYGFIKFRKNKITVV